MNESNGLNEQQDKLYQLHLDLAARLAAELVKETEDAGGGKGHILVTLGALVCFTCAGLYVGDPEGTTERMMEQLFQQCRNRLATMEGTMEALHELFQEGGAA